MSFLITESVSQWPHTSSQSLSCFHPSMHTFSPVPAPVMFHQTPSITHSYLLSSATGDTCVSAIKQQLSSSCQISVTMAGSVWKPSPSKPVKSLMRKSQVEITGTIVSVCVCVFEDRAGWGNRCMAGSCDGGRSSGGLVQYVISDSWCLQSH